MTRSLPRAVGRIGRSPALYTALGAALSLVVAVEWVAFAGLDPDVLLDAEYVVALAMNLPFLAALLYGGRWLRESALPRERYPRIAGWTCGCLAGFLAMNAVLMAYFPPSSTLYLVGWIRWAAAIGAAIGLVVGVTEARAIERARAAERAAATASSLERDREWLEYLNRLLRHEVLNSVQSIEGTATYLREREAADDEATERLATIERQSRHLAAVVRDVRTFIDTAEGVTDFEAVDVTDVVTDELAALREEREGVATEVDAPERALVRADDLLPRLFANLFDNAVEHNDSPTPRVSVDVERFDERVRVRIADNGAGFPERQRGAVFGSDAERNDRGLGLSLVERLVERYGGEIEVTETGPEGSVVTVALPRARRDDGPGVPDVEVGDANRG